MSADGTAGVLLVGGGLAGVTAARTLRQIGYAGVVKLVCDEPHEPYDRPPLSKHYLAGHPNDRQVNLFSPGEPAELGLTLLTGRSAAAVDASTRLLTLDDGRELPFDALLVATGAAARRLPAAEGLRDVFRLRSRDDADAIAEALRGGTRLVVIGAGFIGLEVAAAARTAGLHVTVVEAAPSALTRVLGPQAGDIITRLHQGRGVAFHFGVEALTLSGNDRVESVCFRVGSEIVEVPADAVVVGVGATPAVGWLEGSGLAIDDGVVCDDGGRTSMPGVYAAGDVSRWVNALTGAHRRVEQWQAAREQGSIVGANIAADLGVLGAQARVWESVPYFWSDQYEHKLQFCGSPGAICVSRETKGGWVACFSRSVDSHLTGVLALDAPSALARGRRLVAQGAGWSEGQRWLDSL